MEREADRIGFSVLTGAGFSPQGMASMFEKLERASRFNDSGAFPYLRTHPLNAARIGEARSRLGSTPISGLVAGLRVEHVLAQARARVLMDARVDALRRWQALDRESSEKEGLERLAISYSAALASTLLKEWPQADAAWTRAAALWRTEGRREPRSERWLTLLKVQSLADRGEWAAAVSVMQALGPDSSRPVMMLSAYVAAGGLATKAPKAEVLAAKVAEDLQTWLAGAHADAGAWAALAELWQSMGLRLRSVRADAEVRYASGDWDGAVDRLRAAQRLPRVDSSDFIELSVIDARLRSIEAQRRQWAQETVR
jgi:predicted Zn-dependent protease